MPDSPRTALDDELAIIFSHVLERLPSDVSVDPSALLTPIRPGFTYDIGPDCPRDDLYYRLQACRALQRIAPPELGPIRGWAA